MAAAKQQTNSVPKIFLVKHFVAQKHVPTIALSKFRIDTCTLAVKMFGPVGLFIK